MSPSLHADPLLAHRQEMDALRVRYESEAEFDPELAKACAREIEVLDFALYVGQAPDYERPLIFRCRQFGDTARFVELGDCGHGDAA